MTRINAGIKPSSLCDAHLLAEIRELPRILNTIKSGKAVVKNIPESFRLGSGHVKWFYPRLKYLVNRHKSLVKEAESRGFNVMDYSDSYEGLPKELFNDWKPSQEDVVLISGRINDRLSGMKNLKYNRKEVKLEKLWIRKE